MRRCIGLAVMAFGVWTASSAASAALINVTFDLLNDDDGIVVAGSNVANIPQLNYTDAASGLKLTLTASSGLYSFFGSEIGVSGVPSGLPPQPAFAVNFGESIFANFNADLLGVSALFGRREGLVSVATIGSSAVSFTPFSPDSFFTLTSITAFVDDETIAAVPEPGTLTLLGLGLGLLGMARVRRSTLVRHS